MFGYPSVVIKYPKRLWILAALTSALAGFVDAVGFNLSKGFFVAFMSGNSTRLAMGLSARSNDAAAAATLLALFFVGVICGSLASAMAPARRKPLILVLVSLVLALGAALINIHARWSAAAALALAMGMTNTIFLRDGEVSVGMTYMTGTIVKLGQRVAAVLLGGPLRDCLPYLLLWLGFVSGAVAGALSFATLGSLSLGLATMSCLALAIYASKLPDAV